MASSGVPRIGVTGPDRGGSMAWFFTRVALWRAGARAVRATPLHPLAIEQLDGLVLGGGADVTWPLEPEPFEAPPPPAARWWPRRLLDLCIAPLVLALRWLAGVRRHGVDEARDRMERELLIAARERQLPVLGICRGAQLMNLLEGGSLQHDVQAEERPQLYTALPRREVVVSPGTRLSSLLGRERLLVNSLHFHAIATPGRDCQVVARELNGIVQAIEHRLRPFWIGVQWHPEYLPQQVAHQRLFQALVEHARERKSRAAQTVRADTLHA